MSIPVPTTWSVKIHFLLAYPLSYFQKLSLAPCSKSFLIVLILRHRQNLDYNIFFFKIIMSYNIKKILVMYKKVTLHDLKNVEQLLITR